MDVKVVGRSKNGHLILEFFGDCPDEQDWLNAVESSIEKEEITIEFTIPQKGQFTFVL